MRFTPLRVVFCLVASGCPLDDVEHEGGCPQKVLAVDFDGNDIELLRGTTRVGGDLVVPTSATDLGALRCLQQVDGNLDIYGASSLESLDGLEDLERVGALLLEDLPALRDTSGLSSLREIDESLTLWGLGDLREIEGPRDLERIGGSVQLHDLPVLERWDAPLGVTRLTELRMWGVADGAHVSAFSELEQVDEGVMLEDPDEVTLGLQLRLDALTSISSLRLDGIAQESVDSLGALEDVGYLDLRRYTGVDLRGLSSLREVELFGIYDAPNLRTLAGLEGLERVTGIGLTSAPLLDSIDALSGVQGMPFIALDRTGVTSALPSIAIRDCPVLTDISAIARVPTSYLAYLALANLPALTSIGEWSSVRTLAAFELSNTSVRDIDGLSGVTSLDRVILDQNGAPIEIDSFGLILADNPALLDVDGLDPARGAALENVGSYGEVSILDNAALPTCAAESLTASLAALGRTEGPLEVARNADAACE